MKTAIIEDTRYVAHTIFQTDHDGLLSLGSLLGLVKRDEKKNSYCVRFCDTEYKVELICFPKG